MDYRRGGELPDPVVAPWTPGDLLLLEMSRAMLGAKPDDEVHALLAEYHRALVADFPTGTHDAGGYPLLQGRCIDFLMRNIIRGPKGLVAIDLEWEAPAPVAVDFMLFRSVWNDAIAPNHAWASRRIADFDLYIVRAIQRFYPAYGFGRHAQNKAQEESFLARVGLDPTAPRGRGEAALVMAGKAWGRTITKRIRDKAGLS